ncbi:MAG TPA: TonB-dependent receptor [Candidatus Angelobacter sp.]|nr:TonB-dependent receptor [Candidatus Angelobacter sp.]
MRKVILVSLFAVLLFACAGRASAQSSTGSIVGTVIDSQGLPVDGAVVTLTNLGTNFSYTSTTGSNGGYQFKSIDYGYYRVSVTKSGFKAGVVNNIKLDAATEYSVPPITLEVGATAESVTVEAGAEIVNTTSAEVTSTVEKAQIDSLPILDRNPMALLSLQAGVSNSGPGGAISTTINGQRTSFSNLTIDGINVQDNFIRENALDFTPNLPFNSQAQEFTVVTQNAGVENGGGASQVSIVTPKGTNTWHGEGFWYYRTNAWKANDWFNDASGIPKPGLLQNQGGGNIGGPVLKNKLFIYGYYELLRLRAHTPNNTTILSPAIQAGLAASTPTLPFTYQPVDQTTGQPSGPPQTVDLFAKYSSFAPDPGTMAILRGIPKTSNNTRTGDGVNLLGYQFNARSNNTLDNVGFRSDYELNSHNTFTGTFSWNRQVVDRPDIDTSFNIIPIVSNDDKTKFLSTAWRWNSGGNITNEARFGFNLAPAIFASTQNFSKPGYVLGGFATTLPTPDFQPQGRNTHTWVGRDNVNWVRGNHVITFGGQLQRVTIFAYNNAGITPTYNLGFNGPGSPLRSDFNSGTTKISQTAFNNAVALLASAAGVVSTVSQTFNVTSQTSGFVNGAGEDRNLRQNNWSLYLGDSWKINRKLTFTYGTRWEYYTPVDEKNGLVLLPVIPAGQTVQQTLLGNATVDFAGGPSKRPLYNARKAQFAPNLGLAWDPFGNGKTAVRAGFSMNYVNDAFFTAADNAAVGNSGLNASPQSNLLSGVTVSGLNGQGLTPPTFVKPPFDFQTNAVNATNAFVGIGGLAGYAIDPNIRTPYVEQWNLSLQRDIGWNTSLTVSYVGNHGVGLFRAIDVNQLDFAKNGFLADFNRARSNGFLAAATPANAPGCGPAKSATECGVFNPLFNPSIPGSQQLTVFPLLFDGGSIGPRNDPNFVPTFANLLQLGQIGALEADYHAFEWDTGNNPEPGFNDPVTLFANPFIMGGDLLKNSSFSSYNAGVVEVRRRLNSGLYFQANYVFSKVMTDYSTGTNGDQSRFQPYLDNARPFLEKGRASFDITHAFKANFTYDLPIGKGHKLLATTNKAFGLLVNGWQTGSVFTWQSGNPFSILSQWPSFNRGGSRSARDTAIATLTHGQISSDLGVFVQSNGTVYGINPKLISPDGTGIPSSPQLSCTPAVPGGFCNPQPGQVGNLQLDAFNGPAYFDWDMSASKDFALTERMKLTFRAQAFNLLNHPVFFIGDQSINLQQFGQSSSTVSAPRILQLALQLKF